MKKYLPLINKIFQKEHSKPLTQYNFNFPYGGIILLIILIIFVVFIIYLIYSSKKDKEREEKEAVSEALRMLELRYLHGKISFEEYERLKRDLLEKEKNK